MDFLIFFVYSVVPNVELVKLLIEYGAIVDISYSLPLRLAIRKNHEELVRVLLDAGASMYDSDVDDRTSPLMEAIWSGDENLISYHLL